MEKEDDNDDDDFLNKTKLELVTKLETKLHSLFKEDIKNICHARNVRYTSNQSKKQLILLLVNAYKVYQKTITSSSVSKLKQICHQTNIVYCAPLQKEEMMAIILNQYVDHIHIIKSSPYFTSFFDNKNNYDFDSEEDEFDSNEESESDLNDTESDFDDSDSDDDYVEEEEEKKPKAKTKAKLKPKAKLKVKSKSETKTPPKVKLKSPPKRKVKSNKSKETITKCKKISIPKQVKTVVWDTYIGADIIKHKCLCCKTSHIKNTEFHVGHVVSEKNGGTLAISNLRPVCASCNYSMGSQNMLDYIIKYEYYL